MGKAARSFLLSLMTATLVGGCNFDSDSACYDDAAYLWNDAIPDNRYEGNERYWDAIDRCNQ